MDLPVAAFRSNNFNPDGLHGWCDVCEKRFWKPKQIRVARDVSQRSGRYGLDPQEIVKLFNLYGNQCALCDATEDLVIDHDHESEDLIDIRGILCNSCNKALGKFGDNKEGITRALSYIG